MGKDGRSEDAKNGCHVSMNLSFPKRLCMYEKNQRKARGTYVDLNDARRNHGDRREGEA